MSEELESVALGLAFSCTEIARMALKDSRDPSVQSYCREATRLCQSAAEKAEALYHRIVSHPVLGVPDADDFAAAMGAACVAAGLHVRLILSGRENAWTIFVAVRVAFQLDPEADERESWHVYSAEGRTEWPRQDLLAHATLGVRS